MPSENQSKAVVKLSAEPSRAVHQEVRVLHPVSEDARGRPRRRHSQAPRTGVWAGDGELHVRGTETVKLAERGGEVAGKSAHSRNTGRRGLKARLSPGHSQFQCQPPIHPPT